MDTGQGVRRPRPPPVASRSLQHPSFMPLYLLSGLKQHRRDCYKPTDLPGISPDEFFYSDPSRSSGSRIPNFITDLEVFEWFQLNTPPPIMSTCPAPPLCPDPFRSSQHPILDLGSLTVPNSLHPPVKPGRFVVQLTEEEDQAVTNLLKLHHQEPEGPGEGNPEGSVRGRKGKWSDTELEAANTLLCGFSSAEEEKIWDKTEAKPLDCLPQQCQSCCAGETSDCTQIPSSFSLSLKAFSLKSSFPGDVSEAKKILEHEEDAVQVLLSLGDIGAMDVWQ